ncbi:indolepyruvate ferredoxin oxidoreductase, alpha subunit [Thermanaerovibrio velox DSM 12556]|uniref:Indolepyruvate oxidoreductase subunit IorA n=1 Tax=Thermanaerovibrio velox DSM 12556 TaxID=926567 RepID=H0UP31_9BACT|nr:indolepyruvate ferredoxin oxidoreductase subunit alpha [Thermanaerovibrio velox]EHM10534.1 indolepyruvate ferredoxin oxidoreductase, alpha subunit [Thermanaerovibrio velox DSM 12556]
MANKAILTGNEAIARGAWEAGLHVAAAYPGTPSTEILENLSQYKEVYSEWSVNEKVALEVASGASLGGARALAAMKHVGVNVAADPLFTMAYIGVNGGLVLVSADDPGLFSSQNEQDNRWYALHAKVPMLEPSDSQECKDFIKAAFEISERFDTPVLFRVTTRVCHSKGIVELGEREERPVMEYQRDIRKTLMAPSSAKARHYVVEERLKALRDFSNHCPYNRIEWGSRREVGVIASGIGYQHAREVFGDQASYLKIGFSYPLPDEMIRAFAKCVDRVYVVEENEPYIENFVKQLGIQCVGRELLPPVDELSPAVVRRAFVSSETPAVTVPDCEIPGRPPVLCAGCPHRGIFYAMSRVKDKVVTSDIGCYTLGAMEPLNVGDTVICMGASVSAGVGFQKVQQLAGRKGKVFGVIGDSTFFHSGITGLIDSVYNKVPLALVIVDNRITAMTGHQENPGTGRTLMGEETVSLDIEALCVACGVKRENLMVVDPYDYKACEGAVKAAEASEEPFVIITRRPCALIKDVQRSRAGVHCVVDQSKCVKCKSCLRPGCPAIAMKDGVITIDVAQCNGCGLCMQLCPKGAISREGEVNE